MDITYQKTWDKKQQIEAQVIEDQDFTRVDLNEPIFTDVHFINCIFDRTGFFDVRLYNCDFTNCNFEQVDLTTATIGAHGGRYTNCIFTKCNLRKGYFYRPEFVNCLFDRCKLDRIDFRASSFENCKFIGKMNDVTFYRNYDSDLTVGAQPNPMRNIDFSEAILHDVDFRNCQLETCLLPPDYIAKS